MTLYTLQSPCKIPGLLATVLIFLYCSVDKVPKFLKKFHFHEELSFLKQVFLKNWYPLSFIDNCFKTFVDKLFIKRSQFITVEKKTLFLSLPYLGVISLETRTN